MEENESRKQGGGAFVTFLLVLIILLLSGALVYLRYGDVILHRVYQFTDGRYGAETGVTSLPGRNVRTEEAVEGAEATEEAVEGGEIESEPEEIPVEPEPEPEPEPVVWDYAAAKALPDGITLSTHDFTLRTLGESATIRVTGGSDGPFTWISQNPDVASVDDNGTITAASHGTVNVIVTDGVKKGLCVARMITGATSTDAKLNVSDFTRTVEEGEYQLKVSGVSAPITWTTEDASVATVDENGLVFPVGKGRTRIRAAWDEGYLICVVRVPG